MTTKYNPKQVQNIFETGKSAGIPEEHIALGIARKNGKEKEWNAVLGEWKKSSGYRQSGKSLQDILEEVCAPKLESRSPRVYPFNQEFLAVENIQCVDADDNVFEQYDLLFVRKDIERDESGKQVNFTPNCAIAHFEKEDPLFLPSFALSCNIVAALDQQRDNPEVKPVLMQYKNYGVGHGFHAQNTVIDWKDQEIIHYPHKNDFLYWGGKAPINQFKSRVALPFERTQRRIFRLDNSLSDTTLEKGSKDQLMTRFVRQLTGLENPSVLVEIGNYFGKTARVWVSSSNETRAAWFGCNNSNGLDLVGNCSLISNFAARGVREIWHNKSDTDFIYWSRG